MKKQLRVVIVLPAIIAIIAVFSGFTFQNPIENPLINPTESIVIPDDVNAILDKSCFGCHNMDAKSDKAKKKLLLDELPNLSKAKILAKLDDIHEVVSESEMPPKKFLEKYPDKKLTDEEASRLKEWAKTASDDLLK